MLSFDVVQMFAIRRQAVEPPSRDDVVRIKSVTVLREATLRMGSQAGN
jgi:hypothetical protein